MTISRRSVLAACGAIGGATALGLHRAVAQAAPYRFAVGEAQVTILSDGEMSAPLGWVLPGRDRSEIASALGVSGRSLSGDALPLQVNVTLVRLGAELILVDAGGGPDFAPQRGKLADNLAKAGVTPEAITKVIFTHAHPDHFWGLIDPLDGASLFPKARHFMAGAERDYWLKPGVETTVPDTVRGSAVGTQRSLKELGDRIETFKAGTEIVPGLYAHDTSGHSAGHVSLELRSSNGRLMIGGDALIEPTLSFAHPDWRWGADWEADKGVASRKRLLDQLATDKIPLVGYHLPWPGVGRVERTAGAFRFAQS